MVKIVEDLNHIMVGPSICDSCGFIGPLALKELTTDGPTIRKFGHRIVLEYFCSGLGHCAIGYREDFFIRREMLVYSFLNSSPLMKSNQVCLQTRCSEVFVGYGAWKLTHK